MTVQLKRYLFTANEFEAMGKAGIFSEDDRVELLDGEIVEMAPIGSHHGGTVKRIANLLKERLGQRVVASVQDPVLLGEHSEPQPDIALLKPRSDFYAESHPGVSDILLLIEVADTTAHTDRHTKGPLYASAGVQEYWLVDLEANTLEVYRAPSAEGYRETLRLDRDGSVSPMAFPDVSIAVKDILG